jgi:ParB-like partition proteins
MTTTNASTIQHRASTAMRARPIRLEPEPTQALGTGLSACNRIEQVLLRDIDVADMRYQLRVRTRLGDLVDSLRVHGQQVPVVLAGSAPPYRIIDGFRRSGALAKLGRESVVAIVRDDLSDTEAFRLSFINNVQRRNLNALDKAHAIWLALNREGITKQSVATSFAMSLRQVNRYLQLLEFDQAIQEAMAGSRITMAQAIALSRADVRSPREAIERIERDQLSAPKLKRLFSSSERRAQTRGYIVRERNGFQLREIRYRASMPTAQVKQIAQALRQALEFIHRTKVAPVRGEGDAVGACFRGGN